MRKLRAAPPEFPYKDPTVPLMTALDGGVVYACTVAEKIELLEARQRLKQEDKQVSAVYSFWPGKKRSDVFFIDAKTAIEALRTGPRKANTSRPQA